MQKGTTPMRKSDIRDYKVIASMLAFALVIVFSLSAHAEDVNLNGDNLLGGTQIGNQNNEYNTVTPENQNINTNTTHKQEVKTNQVGPATLTNLTTSGQDTCFGSITGGISLPGASLSGGKTNIDENCVMMKKVKLLASLGLKDAGIAMMMLSDTQTRDAVMAAYPELAKHLGFDAAAIAAEEAAKNKKKCHFNCK